MFVLVVEPDPDVRDLLRFIFERAGFGVLVGREGTGLLGRDRLVAIVKGLPSGPGLLRDLDRSWLLPLIEVAKPFSPRELVAQVRAHIPF